MTIHPKIGLMLASAAILVGFAGLNFAHAGNADVDGYTKVGEDAETGTSGFWVQLETTSGKVIDSTTSGPYAVPPVLAQGRYSLYGLNDGTYVLTAYKQGYKCTPVTITITNGTGQSVDIICVALTGATISGQVTKLRGNTIPVVDTTGVNAATVTVKTQGGGASCPPANTNITVGTNSLPATGRTKNDGGYWVSVPYYPAYHNSGCLLRVSVAKTGPNSKEVCVWSAHDVTWPANSTDVITVNFGPADCMTYLTGNVSLIPAPDGTTNLTQAPVSGGSWNFSDPTGQLSYRATVDLDDADTDTISVVPTLANYSGWTCAGDVSTLSGNGQGESRTLNLTAACTAPSSPSPDPSPGSSPTASPDPSPSPSSTP